MRKRLQAERNKKGLTQKAVAEYLGITEQYYQKIEYGAATGSIRYWDALEDLFEVHQRILRENYPDKEDNR